MIELPKISQIVCKPAITRTRSLNPTKAGNINGKFVPSRLGTVRVRKSDGQVIDIPMNRKQRRLLRSEHGN